MAPRIPRQSTPTPLKLTLILNVPGSAASNPSNVYNVGLTVTDSSGQPSQTLSLPITVIQDFAVGMPTPSTQTIAAGGSASYNLSVLPVGAAFSNALNLSCSSAPVISLCSFTDEHQYHGKSSSSRAPLFYGLGFAVPALALLRKRARLTLPASLLGLFFLALLLPSCDGGGSNGGGGGGGGQGQGTQLGTYTITLTGTSGALSHQASTVTLIVTQ